MDVVPVRNLGWLRLPFLLTFVFLYVPLVVVVVMSFNGGKQPFSWGGFSTRWYGVLAADAAVRQGLINT